MFIKNQKLPEPKTEESTGPIFIKQCVTNFYWQTMHFCLVLVDCLFMIVARSKQQPISLALLDDNLILQRPFSHPLSLEPFSPLLFCKLIDLINLAACKCANKRQSSAVMQQNPPLHHSTYYQYKHGLSHQNDRTMQNGNTS